MLDAFQYMASEVTMTTSGTPLFRCPQCGTMNRVLPGAGGAYCGKCHAPLSSENTVAPAKPRSTEPAELTDANFSQEVLESDRPVLVDCWAPWCGPCRMVAPTIDAIAEKLGDRLKVGKLNTDENPQTAQALRIMSIPTLVVFKGGRAIARQSGVMSPIQLEAWLRQAGVA